MHGTNLAKPFGCSARVPHLNFSPPSIISSDCPAKDRKFLSTYFDLDSQSSCTKLPTPLPLYDLTGRPLPVYVSHSSTVANEVSNIVNSFSISDQKVISFVKVLSNNIQ